jgi:molecular chaperone Hsp33
VTFDKSRIYTFLDETKRFSINFFDAQKFVHDALLIQKNEIQSSNFLRDSLLSYPTLLSFTKPGEEFGLYLDSSNPYFLFKLESFQSKARTLLLPESFSAYPEKISGLCRLQKFIPNNPNPYTSVIEITSESPSEIFNKILTQSYQIDATLFLSSVCNQSVMIYRIPDEGGVGLSSHNSLKNNFNPDRKESLQFFNANKEKFDAVFSKKHNQLIQIVRDLEAIGFEYLVSRVIEFSCRCSKENFVDRISTFGLDEIKQMFSDSAVLDITCDYCKTHYQITKDLFPDLIEH